MIGINDPDEEIITAKTLKGGMSGGTAKPLPEEKSNDIRAVRYCFNPWLHIDLTNRTAPVGHLYLDNGKIIRIDPVQMRQAIHKVDEINFSPLAVANNGDYEFPVRQPGIVMNELLETYAVFGVVELTTIRGIENEKFIENLSVNLLGEEIPSKSDVFIPDFPVPVLPLWFELITKSVKAILANEKLDSDLRSIVKGVYNELQKAFRAGISSAKEVTQEANRRLVDPNEKNKTLSARERRAYLALGEEIPDTMPTVSASANARTARLEEAFVNVANRIVPGEIPGQDVSPARPADDQRIATLEKTVAEQAATLESATTLINRQSAMLEQLTAKFFPEGTNSTLEAEIVADGNKTMEKQKTNKNNK